MARVSKRVLDTKTVTEICEQFTYLLSSLSSETEIENFLGSFLTREEKIMLAKRLAIFLMIKRGYTPSEVQQALHVSYETVRSYMLHYSFLERSFGKTLDRLTSWKKSKEFWAKVERILKPLDLALQAKTNMRARAKLLSGDYN